MSYKLLIALFLLPLLSGCYMKGSVDDVEVTTKVISRSQAIEINSGAKIISTTSGGYQVSQVVGSVSNTIQAKTDAGYQIYTGVQASVFSEGTEE